MVAGRRILTVATVAIRRGYDAQVIYRSSAACLSSALAAPAAVQPLRTLDLAVEEAKANIEEEEADPRVREPRIANARTRQQWRRDLRGFAGHHIVTRKLQLSPTPPWGSTSLRAA